MMKRTIIAWILAASVFAGQAGAEVTSNIYLNPDADLSPNTKVAVLPFKITEVWRDDTIGAQDLRRSVEMKNAEKCELFLLKSGLKSVERQTIDKAVEEQRASSSGYTSKEAIEIGQRLSADMVVVGTIPQWGFYPDTKIGNLEMTVKGFSVKTGGLLFDALFNARFATTPDSFRSDISSRETESVESLAASISPVQKAHHPN